MRYRYVYVCVRPNGNVKPLNDGKEPSSKGVAHRRIHRLLAHHSCTSLVDTLLSSIVHVSECLLA